MRVIYFHQYFSTPDGSNGTRSYEFAKALQKKGHEVLIISLNTDRSITGLENKCFINGKRRGFVDNLEVIEINLNYANRLSILLRSLIFIRFIITSSIIGLKESPELVICSSTPLTVSIPGLILKFFKNIPFVFEVRDLWPELPIAMGVVRNKYIIFLLNIIELISYKYSDALIGLSPGICKGILKKAPLKKVVQIPNACDLDLFKYNDFIKKYPDEYIKKNSSNQKDDFILAFAGAHGKANGLFAVLSAAKELLKLNRYDIQFVLIGDGSEKKKLIDKKNKEEIDNCHFIDPMPKKELSEFLSNRVHVGLMILEDIPAFYEGTSPNKFFDYISSGLPILINYPGWLSEIIKKNKIGVSVPPKDSKAFANAILKLTNSKFKLRQMSLNARKLAENKFSRTESSNKFVNLIEEVYSNFYFN